METEEIKVTTSQDKWVSDKEIKDFNQILII